MLQRRAAGRASALEVYIDTASEIGQAGITLKVSVGFQIMAEVTIPSIHSLRSYDEYIGSKDKAVRKRLSTMVSTCYTNLKCMLNVCNAGKDKIDMSLSSYLYINASIY